MKFIYFFFCFFIALILKAQDFPLKDNKIIYESITNLDNLDKDEIFAQSKIFILDRFGSLGKVIQSEDRRAGNILAKCSSNFEYYQHDGLIAIAENFPFHYTIEISIKEGRSRIRIYDIYTQEKQTKVGFVPAKYYLEELADERRKGMNKNEKRTKKYYDFSQKVNMYFDGIIKDYKEKVMQASKENDW